MFLLQYLLAVFYANLGTISASQCKELSRNTYFDQEQVVGKSWRIYHTWNMNMEMTCLDMTFTKATPEIISRIYYNMTDYLKYQPNWDAAAMLVTSGTGAEEREMLLIAAQGSAGSFVGVPNDIRAKGSSAHRRIVIHKFFMKQLHNGGFILMADCHIGVTTLSAREKPPCRAEVASIVASLPLGEGDSACITDADEHMFSSK